MRLVTSFISIFKLIKQIPCIIILLVIMVSCNRFSKDKLSKKNQLFTNMPSDSTGVNFINKVINKKNLNIFTYRNFYNGGGVGIGDINNDGLPDIYFTSNMGKNKLYLNQGNFKFKDITKSAGVAGKHAWSTGVVMVDINNDGLLDIYVCNAGNVKGDDRRNELFINNGDLTFTEQAKKYGLDDDGFTTQATFFDYDGDGDLDAYILNNSFIPVNTLNYLNRRNVRDKDWKIPALFKGGGDKLLRNDNGKYVDVSEKAGIYGSLIGFGLGVAVGDVNNDGLPDIYVANDFYERDYLYINQGDGTFKEEIEDWIQHLSMSSMGVDVADINNDGRTDIYVADMLPEKDKRLKTISNFESYYVYQLKQSRDFYHQFMQNTLQLNNGDKTFSEIGFLSGVAETDWSWSTLLFDMDNDGYKDIFVTNGLFHDLTNQDFLDYFANSIIQKMTLTGKKEEVDKIINKMPSTPISNYAFKNNHNLTFTNKSLDWGFGKLTFSNGAAYADLDNDGDLDLVINNVNQKALIYKNDANQKLHNNYIRIKLKGNKHNDFAVGSTVRLYIKNQILKQQLIPSRGFQSSVGYTLVFGLGKHKKIDSIQINWSDKSIQMLKNIKANQTLKLTIGKGVKKVRTIRKKEVKKYFTLVKQHLKSHHEDKFIDFDYEPLVPEMLSKEGPCIAVADVDGDGREDVFIGGAKNSSGKLYLQKTDGKLILKKEDSFSKDSIYEDTAAAFFDADGDGDKDLYIGSGGNEESGMSANLVDRLYINDGKGNFTLSPTALPRFYYNTSVVRPYDFDHDGDIDLFVGSLSVSGAYGLNPQSYLLENQGNGRFINSTHKKAKKLENVGMVTDAKWADFTGDGIKDLVVVGKWMCPVIFKNNGNSLQPLKSNLDNLKGDWSSIAVADLNNDGHLDLVLGNRGLNSFYKADLKHPAKLFVNDFDNDRTIEQILTRRINGKDKPVLLLKDISNQLNIIKKLKLSYADYATKSINQLIPKKILANSMVKEINNFHSVVALNNGNNTFTIKNLPIRAQFSSINRILVKDLNKDGYLDLITAGNNYNFTTQFTRLDASFGDVFLGNATGNFKWIPNQKSGFFVKGEVRALNWLHDDKGTIYLMVGINNKKPKLFKLNE